MTASTTTPLADWLTDASGDAKWRGEAQQLCNHLHLGQWELARAFMPRIAAGAPQLLLSLLNALIANPSLARCVGSKSVPSEARLAWLCASEHRRLFPGELPTSVGDHLELAIALEQAFPDGTHRAVCEEVLRYHSAVAGETTPDALSDAAIDATAALLLQDGTLGSIICKLLVREAGEGPEAEADTSQRLVQIQVDAVVSLLASGETEAALGLLARVDIPASHPPPSLEPLFDRLLDASAEDTAASEARGDGAPSRHRRVCSALLAQANPAVCQRFEAAHLSRRSGAQWLQAPELVERMDEPEVWGELLLSSKASSQHFLQHLLTIAVRLTTERQFEALGRLCNHSILAPLRPLFLLVCWDACGGNPDNAEQLLALFPVDACSPAHDPQLSLECRRLWYQLRLARWCSPSDGPSTAPADRGAEAFVAARGIGAGTTTVLHLASDFVDLASADDASLVQMVLERPVAADSPSDEARRAQEAMTARAFGALKQVMQVMHTVALSPTVLPADRSRAFVTMALDQAKQFINELHPAALRLEILENVYSLLFLSREAWEGTLSSATRESIHFLPNEEVTSELLSLVRDCAAPLQNGHGTAASGDAAAGGHTGSAPSMSPREVARLQRLVTNVHEVQWRLQLIRATDTAETSQDSPSGSITRRLLASPTTLLTACLRARDFDRALEVIKMFSIDNSTSKDAMFGQDLADIAAQLSQGAEADDISAVLDRLPPLAALQCCVDLAVTSASSRKACLQLLEKASALLDKVKAGPLTGNEDTTSILALGPVLVQLKSGLDDAASSLSSLVSTQRRPLDPQACRLGRELEDKRRVAHQMLTEALQQERGPGAGGSKRSAGVVETAMKELGRPAEAAGGGEEEAPYVRELFSQLTLLAQADEEAGGGGSTSQTGSTVLDALREGPVETVARLVFERDLSPFKAERITDQLQLDLTRILVQSSCGQVPLPTPPQGRPSASTVDLSAAADGPPDGTDVGTVGLPQFTHDLLARMIALLRQHANRVEQAVHFSPATCEAVRSSAEFAAVAGLVAALRAADFALLADAERFCVYANLVNLLRLHATVVIGPPRASMEWASWSQTVGYSLGTLGLVNLFDLEHVFLRRSLHIPGMFNGCLGYFCRQLPPDHALHSQTVQLAEPDVAFAVWFGGAGAPAPVPLLPATYRSALQHARTHYLMKNVVLSTAGGEGSQLVLPQLLRWFRADLVSQPEPLDGLGDTPLLNYLRVALPAGSRTHSVATNTDASEVAFSAFSWAPLCDVSDIGPVDSRHAPSKPLTLNAFPKAGLGVASAPKHRMQPSTVEYLAGKNQVVATTALLLHPPLESSAKVFAGSPDHHADRPARHPTIVYREHAMAHTQVLPPLHRFVGNKLLPLLTVHEVAGSKLSEEELHTFLFHASGAERQAVCVNVLDEVIGLGDYHQALKLTRKFDFLRDADTDLVLCAAINSTPDPSRSWMLVARLHDKVLAARLVLQHLTHWHVDVCVDLLFFCQCNLLHISTAQAGGAPAAAPAADSSAAAGEGEGAASAAAAEEVKQLLSKVSHKLPRMRVYAQMLARCVRAVNGDDEPSADSGRMVNRWKFWQDIESETEQNPTAVVEVLTDAREFALARRWAILHDVSEAEIDQNYLLSLLLTGDTVRAHQVLESLAVATAVTVCDYLLQRLEGLDKILFVVRFLLRNAPGLAPHRRDELRELTMGCTALLVLPERLRPVYSHLRGHPHRVVEQLLMNKHVDIAAKVLQQFPVSDRTRLIRLGTTKGQGRPKAAAQAQAVASAAAATDAMASLRGLNLPASRSPDKGSGATLDVEIEEDLVSFYARHALQFPSRSRSTSQVSGHGPALSGPQAALARQQAHASRVNVSVSSQGRQQQTATNWISDQDAKHCAVCDDEFSVLKRRHHCRYCGNVVCGKCSRKKLRHPDYDTPVRTCDTCYADQKDDVSMAPSVAPSAAPSAASSVQSNFVPPGRHPPAQDNLGESVASRDSASDLMACIEDGIESTAQVQQQLESTILSQTDDSTWHALPNDGENLVLRNLFCYEQAPDTTLCMTLLDLYPSNERRGDVCLHLCNELSKQLAARPRQMDHYLVISSIRRLLYNAKLKFLDCQSARKVELCDTYLGNADLLRDLLVNRCDDVPSITDLSHKDVARRLRDRLIQDDKFELAVQVATKCRVEPQNVWAGWGLAHIQMCSFTAAREKIARAMKGSDGGGQRAALLLRVIDALERSPCPAVEDMKSMQAQLRSIIEGANRDDHALQLATSHAYRQRIVNPTPGPDGRTARPRLVDPLAAVNAVSRGRVSMESNMDSERFHEAVHYYSSYAPADQLASFYCRHGFLDRACTLVLAKNISDKAFVDIVFLPTLARNQLANLKRSMRDTDATLAKWRRYLLAACRALTTGRRLYHVLYDIQLFMADHVRAGLTAVQFATAPGLPAKERLAHLQQARKHFGDGEQELSAGEAAGAGTGHKLSLKDIRRHIDILGFQADAVQLFDREAQAAAKGPNAGQAVEIQQLCELNLFGGRVQQQTLAANLMFLGGPEDTGLEMATKIVRYFSLPTVVVYAEGIKMIAQARQTQRLNDYIARFKGVLPDDDWDQVVRTCVDVYVNKVKDLKQAEKFTNMIVDDEHKISAHMVCGKLIPAYLLAVRIKSASQVARIRAKAVETNNSRVQKLCDTYLAQNAQ